MTIKTNSLTPEARAIIKDGQTECPFSGHEPIKQSSTAICRQCGLALFRSTQQFDSGTGWPSFDQAILDHVLEKPDADGMRTEIQCQRCQAHLGHVFRGEKMTARDTRFCVNRLSIEWLTDPTQLDTDEIIVAGGCFWGVQQFFSEQAGIVKTEVGYSGGHLHQPTYQQVCEKKSGHFECVRLLWDPQTTDCITLLQHYFQYIDPSQTDGQGPDIGPAYHSAIFYFNTSQQQHAQNLKNQLIATGISVATQILPAQIFWPAEDYHQHYLQKKQS